jgi:hypothetical protein
MKAFEVLINGHHVCLAGIGGDGVLTAIVNWVGDRSNRENMFLSVGGLDGTTDEYTDWAVPTIGVGAEITIRVVEATTVDPPTARKPRERDEDRPDQASA